MAATSYAQLKKQIAALEIQAAKQKTAELSGVVAKLKETISLHGLTAEDLFGASSGKNAKTPGVENANSASSPKAAKAAGKGAAGDAAKYSNGEGGVWGGRGKRPQWLRDALASGRKMEDFIQQSHDSSPAPDDKPASKPVAKKAAKVKRAGKPAKKAAAAAKYNDGAGNSWSGMGPKPKWFKDALAAGKKPEELSAPAPAA